LPDKEDGFVLRGEGEQPTNLALSRVYRERMIEGEALFVDSIQRELISEVLVAAEKQRFSLHFAATEPTHLHVLVSWGDDTRPWNKVRNAIKSSLTRRLNRECGKRQWFSDSASRHRVTSEDHFNYLVATYLPRHSGWKWSVFKGLHITKCL
jgi:hypothetical protein